MSPPHEHNGKDRLIIRADRRERNRRRRLRIRRRSRRAYIRSVYFLPSLATLGNGICGFAAIYVAGFDNINVGADPWAKALFHERFIAAVYFIFLAMIFDALDGRLARFARHTTDFGGQLDSLADVISFGCAPAFIALQAIKSIAPATPLPLLATRLIWATGAFFVACAMVRLARFNVSNDHGEQHHFSFFGLPSPGAAGAVVGLVLIQQTLRVDSEATGSRFLSDLSSACVVALPLCLLICGALMVSAVRYPHVINRYLRGRKPITNLITALVILLLLVISPHYTIGVGLLAYALWGAALWAWARRPGRHARPIPELLPAHSHRA